MNRPCSGINLDAITEELAELSGVIIQALFASGKGGNVDPENRKARIDRLRYIGPKLVQRDTTDRGYFSDRTRPASRQELEEIKAVAENAKIPAKIHSKKD
ncbi:MAG: hypothetical protein ACE5L7_04550 [Candidatus Aminicenantales bacterium]